MRHLAGSICILAALAPQAVADDWAIVGPSPSPSPTASPSPTPEPTPTIAPTPTPLPDFGPRPPKPPDLTVFVTGDPLDSDRQPVNGPGLLLMGGGSDVNSGFSQRAYPVANGGDVVIIRVMGSDGYNNYLYNLVNTSLKPNSVETMILNSRTKANSDYAYWVIRTAELVFMAGGDQSDYVNYWQGTRAEDAIHEVHARGGVIGGTSAGLAVMGQFIYDPDGVSAVTSAQAIANPYTNRIVISDDFLDFPPLRNVITDSHFRQRDRMGRSLAFMARLRQDGRAPSIVNIAISEATCLFIDKDGQGVVNGTNEVYILREDDQTDRVQVQAGQPLIYRNVLRTRLVANDTVDVTTWNASKQPIRLTVDGTTASPHISPSNYYD